MSVPKFDFHARIYGVLRFICNVHCDLILCASYVSFGMKTIDGISVNSKFGATRKFITTVYTRVTCLTIALNVCRQDYEY